MLDLASFIHKHHARLLRLATRVTGNDSDAQDALQDAYLRGFVALRGGRFEGRASLETWLYTIVRNCACDARRRRARFVTCVPTQSDVRAFERIAARATLQRLGAVMAELPSGQSDLILRRCSGESNRALAAEQACSVGAIEQRLVRARAHLRRFVS